MNHIVFLALGSRGDLQPLVVLATHYRQTVSRKDRITIVSPFDIHAPFRSVFDDYSLSHYALPTPSTPANSQALSDEVKQQIRWSEAKFLWQACEQLCPTVIVFTTFALEGWSIAEKLSVPSVAISLFPLDCFPCPPSFESMFISELPELHHALRSHGSWNNVLHWMWHLFLENHGTFREEILDLNPVPFVCDEDIQLPATFTPLLYALDHTICEGDIHHGTTVGFFWDKNLFQSTCRSYYAIAMYAYQNVETYSADPIACLSRFIRCAHDQKRKLVYIGFGSMDQLHPTFHDPEFVCKLVRLVGSVLEQVDAAAVWVMSNTDIALYKAFKKTSNPNIHVYPHAIPHVFLLMMMQYGMSDQSFDDWWSTSTEPKQTRARLGAIHHGGAGTLASILSQAIPQVIMPLMFDQFFWADKATELNFGKKVPCDLSEYSAWIEAVEWMISDPECTNQKRWQKTMMSNTVCGLAKAAETISRVMIQDLSPSGPLS
ncbi:hypothetical protein DFQ28_003208 [Apophysomyces sp. BC1034]|nr:hypothetical protein DFQ30_000058 [Apophysomyces sp. BC1015]KAG0183437.1 hypothetical protein DFQ29_004381 [Apophysomyces sp. BC1021]KAG0193804.1 hypothetical protein DFQ28_003208 [Apophysomyces sp. BC1034]